MSARGFLQAALVLFALILLWRILVGIATVALVLLTGLMLAVALSGPVEALHRRKVPRMLGTGLIAVGILALLSVVGYLLLPVLVREFSRLTTALPQTLSYIDDRLGSLAGEFGVEVGNLSSSGIPGSLGSLLGGALGLFGTLASAVFGVVVAAFVAVYLAADPGPAARWVVRLFPPAHRSQTEKTLFKIRDSLLSWLKGRLASMAVVGALSIGALYIIGVPGALSLGVFAGLASFVPYVGPVVSVIPPALFALAEHPVNALWVLVAYFGIQQIESYLITPLIMEEAAALHPAVVIGAVTVLGTAFGLVGALLALPIIVVVGVLIEELWFSRLEGGDSEKDPAKTGSSG